VAKRKPDGKLRIVRLWVGFEDGKPAWEVSVDGYQQGGVHLCAYSTRAAAKARFTDVRKLVFAYSQFDKLLL
jgi:hypothetical protein